MSITDDSKIPLLVVTGPTATGKTDLAIALAKNLKGEIVSGDSMQVYKHMDIGTATPTMEERQGIPHHLMDILEPDESFSVARYVELAAHAIDGIAGRGGKAIVAGGTGLYITSLIDGIVFSPVEGDEELRRGLLAQAESQGNLALWQELEAVDPALAGKLHPNNVGRVVRALEIYALTGIPMSEHQRRSRSVPSRYDPLILALCYRNMETLYSRIDLRVDKMVEQGLVSEVKGLMDRGYSPTAFQAIGYKELFDFHNGLCTLEDALEAVKMSSRRYAKRQMTWLRRDPRVHWLAREDYPSDTEILEAAMEIIDRRRDFL